MKAVLSVWTFAVELEAGQLGVDANGNGSNLVKGGAQRLLVTHRNLLVAITGGSPALRAVLAGVGLDTATTTTTLFHFASLLASTMTVTAIIDTTDQKAKQT